MSVLKELRKRIPDVDKDDLLDLVATIPADKMPIPVRNKR